MYQSSTDHESFWGFDLADDEIGQSDYSKLALEVKHLFESVVLDADEKNQEVFLSKDLVKALKAFVSRPSNFTLCVLLSVSPSMYEPIVEMTRLVSPSLLTELPLVL